MDQREVVIAQTGTANTASVRAAFERLGLQVRISTEPEDLRDARLAVLPGVGSFARAADELDRCGLREPLVERIERNLPTLAICLGMQLFGEASDESPDASGLGAYDGRFERFTGDVRVPQLGWNRVTPAAGSRFVTPGWAVYANTYRLVDAPQGWLASTTDYGGEFVGALERGSILLCQFHPELSGAWGRGLLTRWVETAEEVA